MQPGGTAGGPSRRKQGPLSYSTKYLSVYLVLKSFYNCDKSNFGVMYTFFSFYNCDKSNFGVIYTFLLLL